MVEDTHAQDVMVDIKNSVVNGAAGARLDAFFAWPSCGR